MSSVNVIHRDISSKNVFVSTGFETIKLGDFGYSSLVEHHKKDREDPLYGHRITDDIRVFAGAPAYKAPELLTSKPCYSEASDIYAFSIVCWELVTTLWSGTYGRPWSDIDDICVLTEAVTKGIRPVFDSELYQAPSDVVEKTAPLVMLVERCWDDSTSNRPTFLEAHDSISHVFKKKDLSLSKVSSRVTTVGPLDKTKPLEKTQPMQKTDDTTNNSMENTFSSSFCAVR